MFHLRFDHRSEEDLTKHLDFILRLPGKDKLVVLENKSTTAAEHTHAIFSDSRSLSRVRASWKEKFPDVDGKADKQYQCKAIPEGELDAARRYLCKGEKLGEHPRVLMNKGFFTLDVIESLHVEYWKINSELKPKNATLVVHQHEHVLVRAPPKKKPTFFQSVIDHLDRMHPERKWRTTDWKIMFAALYKFHGVNFRPWGPQQLMNELRVLLAHYCYEEYFTDAMDEIIKLGYLRD